MNRRGFVGALAGATAAVASGVSWLATRGGKADLSSAPLAESHYGIGPLEIAERDAKWLVDYSDTSNSFYRPHRYNRGEPYGVGVAKYEEEWRRQVRLAASLHENRVEQELYG